MLSWFIHPHPFATPNPMVTDGRKPQPGAVVHRESAASHRPASNKEPCDFPIPMGAWRIPASWFSKPLLGNNLKIPEQLKEAQRKGSIVMGQLITTLPQARAIFIIYKLVSKKEAARSSGSSYWCPITVGWILVSLGQRWSLSLFQAGDWSGQGQEALGLWGSTEVLRAESQLLCPGERH